MAQSLNTTKIGQTVVSFFTLRKFTGQLCTKLTTSTSEQHRPFKVAGYGWIVMNVVHPSIRDGALYHDAFGPLSEGVISELGLPGYVSGADLFPRAEESAPTNPRLKSIYDPDDLSCTQDGLQMKGEAENWFAAMLERYPDHNPREMAELFYGSFSLMAARKILMLRTEARIGKKSRQ